MSLNLIDLESPNISYTESLMLQAMLEKREQYIAKNRHKEAQGAGTIIWMYWKWIHAFPETLPTRN